MPSFRRAIQFIAVGLAAAAPKASESYDRGEVIQRDVAIIGGGSSGTYAAIRLQQQGKSVVVIEAKDKIGGHTETYKDPATGTPINIGVVVWDNIPVVQSYADSLNVPLIHTPPQTG